MSVRKLPKLLSIREVAETTGFCEKTIRRRIADGDLTATRVGPRAIRIREDEVLAWLGSAAA